MTEMRKFESGAVRDDDAGKLDFEGFLSPLVLERYAQYMHEHRKLADGSTRTGDNWKRGMPLDAYMKSAWRHFMAWWVAYRAEDKDKVVDIEESICALLFNASGFLHQRLVEKQMPQAKPAVVTYNTPTSREYVRCLACLGIYPEHSSGGGPELHACEPAPCAAERTNFDKLKELPKPILPRREL